MSVLSINSYEEIANTVTGIVFDGVLKQTSVNVWAVIVEGASDYKVFGSEKNSKKYAREMASKTGGHFIVLKTICGYFKNGPRLRR